LAKTAIDYSPMQDPASFNLDAVKKQIEEMIKQRPGWVCPFVVPDGGG
jgi:arylsulfatase